MSINDLNLANSSLEVKASGNIDFSKDLELPEGKSIAELLSSENSDIINNEPKEKENS